MRLYTKATDKHSDTYTLGILGVHNNSNNKTNCSLRQSRGA